MQELFNGAASSEHIQRVDGFCHVKRIVNRRAFWARVLAISEAFNPLRLAILEVEKAEATMADGVQSVIDLTSRLEAVVNSCDTPADTCLDPEEEEEFLLWRRKVAGLVHHHLQIRCDKQLLTPLQITAYLLDLRFPWPDEETSEKARNMVKRAEIFLAGRKINRPRDQLDRVRLAKVSISASDS